jgi:Tol biopolymer transport system component
MRVGFRLGLIGVATAVALLVPGAASAATAGKIAFVSDRDGTDEIWVMNADGSGQTPITNSPSNVVNRGPSWSPDGKQIAFFSDRDNPTGDRELWIMNADGSSPRQITFNDVDDFSVDWAPSGMQLVFDGPDPAGVDNIQLINADGTGLTPLTHYTTEPGAYGPHFSPDGQWIVFTNDGSSDTTDPLALIRPDGSLLHNINNVDSFSPDFIGDGSRILFETEDDGDEDIYTMKPDGTELKNITNTPSIPGSTDDERSPSPSRDGLNRIAFSSFRGGDQELYVMNGDGTGQTQLTNTAGTNRGPDWQPTAMCHGRVATIVGTDASESLLGGPGIDIIAAIGGADVISGVDGDDVICGDAKDTLNGGNGKDLLDGGPGKDKLNGGPGKDKLIGGKGNDKLNGSTGKDTCIGGKGHKDKAKSCEKEKKIP